MVQEPPFIPVNWRQLVLWLVAAIFGSSFTTAIVTSWLERRRRRADVDHTDASTSETRVRTRVAEGDAIVRYIGSLSKLQDDIDELRRERDDSEARCLELIAEVSHLRTDLAQANTTIQLNEQFIARLHAATKLGMELSGLPPSIDEVIEMLETIRRVSMAGD